MRTRSSHLARAARRRGLAAGVAASVAVSLLGVTAPFAANAAEAPAPTAHYDMSHAGSSLLDVSGHGRHATLTGLTDASFADAAGDDVLRFRADGYAALPQGLVTGADNDFTVEYTVSTQTAANHFGWVIGDGVGAWNTTQLGNHVFLPARCEGDLAIVAHEVTHCAQYQSWGPWRYYARGAGARIRELVHRHLGFGRSPYAYHHDPDRSFHAYGMEEQAQIVEDALRGSAAARAIPELRRCRRPG